MLHFSLSLMNRLDKNESVIFIQSVLGCSRGINFSPEFLFTEPVAFMHFGKVLYGAVDMRAEVGLLSKNVVIRGEMEETCPEYNDNCKDSKVRGLDTFGGHIKVWLKLC